MSTGVVVPPSQPAEVRRPDGDADGATTLAETIRGASVRFEQVWDGAANAAIIGPGIEGTASAAYERAATTVSNEHAAMSQTLQRVRRAVTTYADTLRELVRRWEDLVERKAALDAWRAALLADATAATAVADPAADAQQDLRERAAELRAGYAELVADHDDLHRRVQEAEDLLRQSFESGSSLEQAKSASGGVSSMAQEVMARAGAPGTGATPQQVHDWWAGLDEGQREAVVAAYPQVVGQADGLPAEARDDANRQLLREDLAMLEAKQHAGTLLPDERQRLANALQAQAALENAGGHEDPITGEHPVAQLYLYDPMAFGGDGRVAISVGDLDTATDVAVFTPGINTDMSDTTRYTDQMANLHDSARYNGDGSSVATMFWLGYDAPSGPLDPATLTEPRAEDGGRRLSDTIAGMRASRPDDPAHLTAIGHSYGSTATSYATAAPAGLPVDDVALIGSPGTGPVEDAGGFGIGRDHVYVGRDSRDGVAMLGDEGWVGKGPVGLGEDPSSEDFGARRFQAEAVDRPGYTNFDDSHGSYLDHDSESLYNLGRIVDGQGGAVVGAAQTYDPWYWDPVDPEWGRGPSSDVPGQSRTRSPEDR